MVYSKTENALKCNFLHFYRNNVHMSAIVCTCREKALDNSSDSNMGKWPLNC
jgi:hypothetical protein